MKKLLVLIAFLFAYAGCTDEPATRATLRKAGFTDVKVTGYEAWSCGEGDTYSTGFRAKNSQGLTVTGVVCCGMFGKACTIRF